MTFVFIFHADLIYVCVFLFISLLVILRSSDTYLCFPNQSSKWPPYSSRLVPWVMFYKFVGVYAYQVPSFTSASNELKRSACDSRPSFTYHKIDFVNFFYCLRQKYCSILVAIITSEHFFPVILVKGRESYDQN